VTSSVSGLGRPSSFNFPNPLVSRLYAIERALKKCEQAIDMYTRFIAVSEKQIKDGEALLGKYQARVDALRIQLNEESKRRPMDQQLVQQLQKEYVQYVGLVQAVQTRLTQLKGQLESEKASLKKWQELQIDLSIEWHRLADLLNLR
jgi:chromosome segregation ATPase